MNKLNNSLIGKTIECGEEWFMGQVYYEDIYKKGRKFYGKRKIYYNPYGKNIDIVEENKEVFVPFGFKVLERSDLLGYEI